MVTQLPQRRIALKAEALLRREFERADPLQITVRDLRLALEKGVETGELDRNDVPHERTIRRFFDDYRGIYMDSPVRLVEIDPPDVPLFLALLGRTTLVSRGRVTHITHAEWDYARRIAVIPDAPDLWDVRTLAREYMLRAATGSDTADLDLLLAFSPWDDAPPSNESEEERRQRAKRTRQYRDVIHDGAPVPPTRLRNITRHYLDDPDEVEAALEKAFGALAEGEHEVLPPAPRGRARKGQGSGNT